MSINWKISAKSINTKKEHNQGFLTCRLGKYWVIWGEISVAKAVKWKIQTA